jgi:two-component system nitrate/nitrite response regulator NarL
MLGSQRDFKIVALCTDGGSCLQAVRIFQPDITIVGASAPGFDRREIIDLTISENAETRLVLYKALVEDDDAHSSQLAGVSAVIPADVNLETLVQVLRRVVGTQRFTSYARVVPVEQRMLQWRSATTTLTSRERLIARLVGEGLSNKEIGRRLNLTDGTIKVHVHHIFQKLKVTSRTALAAFMHAEPRTLMSTPRLEHLEERMEDT